TKGNSAPTQKGSRTGADRPVARVWKCACAGWSRYDVSCHVFRSRASLGCLLPGPPHRSLRRRHRCERANMVLECSGSTAMDRADSFGCDVSFGQYIPGAGRTELRAGGTDAEV